MQSKKHAHKDTDSSTQSRSQSDGQASRRRASGPRSFSDRETHFSIIKSTTPVTVDGFALHEPTGEVQCCECDRSHHNIDEIPHQSGCAQRWVRSHWWVTQMQADR